MSDVIEFNCTVSREIAAIMDQAVESGEYESQSELVRDLLRGWRDRRRSIHDDRERLKSDWAEGIASGPGRFTDIEAIKAEARRRWSAGEPRPVD